MPSHEKYSRSRSPIDERSNRHKHEDNRRRRSPSSPHRHNQTRDRTRAYNYEDRRVENRHKTTDNSRYNRESKPSSGNDRSRHPPLETTRSDRSRHDTFRSRSPDQRASGSSRTEASKNYDSKNLRPESGHNKDYGRLNSSRSPLNTEPDDPQVESTRKRKADVLDVQKMTNSSVAGRRSRFDKPDQSLDVDKVFAESHHNSASSTIGQDVISKDPGASSSKQASIPETDQEKLRQRQERLALWKKKKLEDARKKHVTESRDVNDASKQESLSYDKNSHLSLTITSNIKEHVDSPLRVSGSSKPSVGIGKFGMIAKQTNAFKPIVPSKTLGFVEEEQSGRSLSAVEKSLANSIGTNIAGSTDVTQLHERKSNASDDDEVDPLDAFMAENSASLGKSTGTGRSAGDIINDQESDDGDEEIEEDDILALAAKKLAQRKKDIVTINHATQDYEHFRKDFYVEPEELADLSERDLDALRLELDGIVIRGKDCPKPILNWGQCGLSADTLEQIQRLGYDSPTSIQAQAIPAIMSGRDTIGVAKTGSGKTMAFLLPMFRHIKDQRPLESSEGPIAMILTPTRELAVQIHKECKPFLKALELRAVCVYGGPPIKEQIAEFKRGAEIVVCTPGRMIDILAANQGRVTNLKRITYTVLDEADRMFDLGFEPQVMKIINNIRPQRQTVLFSATFPKSMEALARKILRGKPVEITVGARSVVAPEITQKIEIRPRDPDPLKFNRVLEILGELYNNDEDARTLIFVDRQEAADTLLYQLMRKGYPCNALHGGKDQYDRDSTISDFKAGIFPILVATSVAARGLDVKQLKLVINYDCPNHMEDYVHRVGRTGRAGNTGTAITFISEDQERYAFDIARALRLSQVTIPDPLKVLADAFAEKVKSGVEKGSVAGFGGKGLAKFDTARDKEKRVQRKIYGEDDELEDDSTTRQVELSEDDDNNDSDNDRVNPEEVKAVEAMGTSASADAPIKVEKVTAQMRQATMAKPNVGTKALDPVAAARARIDAINNRIKTGTKPLEQVASNPDAGEYRAMMEINDYPQKARWNVTNRTNIAKVLEATGTSITTQGQYVKPGSSAPAGVPKLYLLIEGPTELCVTDAVKELRRLLAEGTLADADAAGTRYKVV